MMYLKSFALAIATFTLSTQANAWIVKAGFSNEPVFYHTDELYVYRSDCPATTSIYSPEICVHNRKRVYSESFHEKAEKEIIPDLVTIEIQVREIYVKMAQLDNYLLQFTVVDPTSNTMIQQKQEIDALLVDIAAQDLTIKELTSQQQQLEASIQLHPTPDLRSQLADVVRQLRSTQTARNTKIAKLERVRGLYIANGSHTIDQDTYLALMNQRHSYSEELQDHQGDYAHKLDMAVKLARVFKYLEISPIAFEYLELTSGNVETFSIAHRFGSIFQNAWDAEHPIN